MFDVNDFNFDSMKEAVGIDPFAKTSDKFAEDARFFKLAKDKEGNGKALIRFLPDKNKNLIQEVFKINTTIVKGDKKRFVNEYSPLTIGLPCPFQEMSQKLFNEGNKEEAKKFNKNVRYIANIKVIKDLSNPANDGKIFLLDMSGSLKNKLEKAMNVSDSDKELGKTAKELFNPFKGNSFLLVAQMGDNKMINYDASEPVEVVNSIYESVEAGLTDIRENTYPLSEFRDPATFLSYEKLTEKLKYVTFANQTNVAEVVEVQTSTTESTTELVANVTTDVATETVNVSVPVETTQTTPSISNTNLDDLLKGL